jgi:hypothetical protein
MTDPQWFSTGLISSYPDLGLDDDQSEPGVRPSDVKTGCKVFRVPPADEEASAATALDEIADPAVNGGNFSNQVLVFRYRGKMHAMDHVSGQSCML